MIDSYPRYKNYKDSGNIEIGEIPNHWKSTKLGRVGLFSASGIDKKIYKHEKIIRMVNYTDVYGNQKAELWNNDGYMLTSAPIDKVCKYELKKGDILFTPSSETIDEIGLSAVVMEDMPGIVFSYHLLRLRPSDHLNLRFSKYFCNYPGVLCQFSSLSKGTTRNILTQDNFKNIVVVLPPVNEQERIASFLEQKTSKIDVAIAKKQRLIELLEERKNILINQAVTKGLNPDVPMKDSGVDWIGEIPEHWEVRKNRYLFLEKNDRSEKGEETHLSMSQKFGLIPSEDLDVQTLQSESYEGAKLCFQGDLVLNRLKAHLAVFSVASMDGLVSSDYSVYRLINSDHNPYYFENLFKTPTYLTQFNKRVKGIVIGFYRLYSDEFMNISAIIPPVSEQDKIMDFIKQLQDETELLVKCIQSNSGALAEYKSILISNSVTGKIKI